MKLELKTENENFSTSFFNVFIVTFVILLLILISSFTVKFSIIAKYYEVNYLCRLLKVDKSTSNFKKLSRLSNQKSKQKILDFCREIIK